MLEKLGRPQLVQDRLQRKPVREHSGWTDGSMDQHIVAAQSCTQTFSV